MNLQKSLQERYAPKSICFGCGPANEKGLKIRSFEVEGSSSYETTAEFFASLHHEAFPGMLNGGILGSLLDCHSNWTAAYALMKKLSLKEPPCTVTADFHVKLKAPTPTKSKIVLKAEVIEFLGEPADRAKIKATLYADGKLTATCEGLFVAVKPGHPAFHRWG